MKMGEFVENKGYTSYLDVRTVFGNLESCNDLESLLVDISGLMALKMFGKVHTVAKDSYSVGMQCALERLVFKSCRLSMENAKIILDFCRDHLDMEEEYCILSKPVKDDKSKNSSIVWVDMGNGNSCAVDVYTEGVKVHVMDMVFPESVKVQVDFKRVKDYLTALGSVGLFTQDWYFYTREGEVWNIEEGGKLVEAHDSSIFNVWRNEVMSRREKATYR